MSALLTPINGGPATPIMLFTIAILLVYVAYTWMKA